MDPVISISIFTLGLLGLLFGGGLAYASKKFAVKTDPRLAMVVDLLPGANCGGCGFPGCTAFAEAVLKGETPVTACNPGGAATAEKIAKLLGVEFDDITPMIAVVQCQGGKDVSVDRFSYSGIKTCAMAHKISGGHKACAYGCLGFGDCVRVCSFDAIIMREDGLPVVDEQKCTACGACVRACPRDIMKLIPLTQQVYVGCVSQDKGKAVKDVCKLGCIGCSLCAKVTPSGAIKMNGNLPEIDPSGTDLVIAVHKCPTKSLIDRVKVRTKISIDTSCDGCTECVKVCPVKGAIEGEQGQRHKVVFAKCIGCGICIPACP
ncbi:MAG TPA: Fe-S cluster domain-containing protein, partial [archaeon]|nr:Fe-S cluster domain-containing protein [archaeon]